MSGELPTNSWREGPWSDPRDISCVLGPNLAPKTSKSFSKNGLVPVGTGWYPKRWNQPQRRILHAPPLVYPKISPREGKILFSHPMFYAEHRWYM